MRTIKDVNLRHFLKLKMADEMHGAVTISLCSMRGRRSRSGPVDWQSSAGLGLARLQCAECHLVEKGQGESPNPAAPTFEHIANISGMTGMALTAALRTSHGTMPNVMIKGSDIADVVAYILSLKDGD